VTPVAHAEELAFAVDERSRVTGLLLLPATARACYVFAHGAGAGMAHPFMHAIATGLGAAGVASLRFQFPYMQRGWRRPDPPAQCQATVRAAVVEATRVTHGLPLVAGGRSFGGRMSSQAQAESPLPGVRGLAFLGFPLHTAQQPSAERARHLAAVSVPLLFLQGDRDELADLALLEKLMGELGERATLRVFAHANHAFHVPARSGRTDRQVLDELVQSLSDWIGSVAVMA
jgi:uncharacterized protein